MSPAVASHYYTRTGFRPGVEYLVGDARAVFTYDLTSFDVDVNAAAAARIDQLCDDLSTGLEIADIEEAYGDFSSHVWDLLDAFDRYGFITEIGPRRSYDAISGPSFWRQVEAFSARAKAHFKPVFYPALASGLVSRGTLIRYAQEYFHVVRAGPRIIAGALPHTTSRPSRQLLETFLRQELGHEVMLLRSLAAVGISEAEAREALPLPETFAVISGLQTMADQEPLSFKALVFLLEEASPEFHDALVAACEAVGLGEDFWSPIVAHADINDDGDHGSISAELLEHVELVTSEESLVVSKQLASMIEALVAFEHAVLAAENELGSNGRG